MNEKVHELKYDDFDTMRQARITGALQFLLNVVPPNTFHPRLTFPMKGLGELGKEGRPKWNKSSTGSKVSNMKKKKS